MNQVLAEIAEADKYHVLVGVMGDKAARSGDDGVTNAMLAYVHEYGSPARNIPARPHIMPGIQAALGDIERLSRAGILAALNGQNGAVMNLLGQVGAVAVGSIQQKIATGPFAPLAPQTIKRKGSSKPLIDTGQYRQSFSYKVVERGE